MARVRTFVIEALWDEEAEVWYVGKSDVPGLAAEADTIDELVENLKVLVPELLEANGVISCDDEMRPVPFRVMHNYLAGGSLSC
jgi:predicted RNase H-like HicB family nuclease